MNDMTNEVAIHNLQSLMFRVQFTGDKEALKLAINVLKQQKTGRWLPLENGNPFWRRCSECDATRRMIGYFENYCPSCGAKMQEEGDTHGGMLQS